MVLLSKYDFSPHKYSTGVIGCTASSLSAARDVLGLSFIDTERWNETQGGRMATLEFKNPEILIQKINTNFKIF